MLLVTAHNGDEPPKDYDDDDDDDNDNNNNNKVKSKAIPLQAWTGPEGFKEVGAVRFQDNRYMNVVSLSALSTGRFYPPGNIPGTFFVKG